MFILIAVATSLRMILMIPAMMFPPLSVTKLTLISVASFFLSSLILTSLFTGKSLKPLDCISGEMGLAKHVEV